ncbi:MAG: ATPase domain-containing protein [Candidatus Woesearchaeota archaeon]
MKVHTGIPGFDELTNGGFTKGSINLLVGGPATGKTTFCLQYLWNGLKSGEPGIYIAFEQEIDAVRAFAMDFGWDFSIYENSGLMQFLHFSPFGFSDTHQMMLEMILKSKAERLVFDSISIYGLFLENSFEFRKDVVDLSLALKKKKDSTVIFSGETLEQKKKQKISRFDVEEFIADSIIKLSFESLGGQFPRSIQVRKMRRTLHDMGVHPLEITNEGLVVHF